MVMGESVGRCQHNCQPSFSVKNGSFSHSCIFLKDDWKRKVAMCHIMYVYVHTVSLYVCLCVLSTNAKNGERRNM